jgi:hypothetical protein
MTEIEYEVREQDLIAFNEHQLAGSESMQKTLRRHQATIPGLVVVISLFLFFYYQDLVSAAYVGVIAVLWGVGAPAYLKWSWRKQIRKMYTEEEKACVLGRYALRAEKDGLAELGPAGESKMSWGEILRIELTKKYAFIFVSLDTALIVPRATVSKGDLHAFAKEADERIEKAA